MKRTREQIKAELMKKAEQEIDRLLEWEEKADKPTLTQFENQVLRTRKALSEAMLDEVMGAKRLASQPSQSSAPRVDSRRRIRGCKRKKWRHASGRCG